MKKIIICVALLLSSCSYKTNRIYYTKNINKCIHNLEQMQRWLHEDYAGGVISEQAANNYMIVVINTKCSLYKKIKEENTDCTD